MLPFTSHLPFLLVVAFGVDPTRRPSSVDVRSVIASGHVSVESPPFVEQLLLVEPFVLLVAWPLVEPQHAMQDSLMLAKTMHAITIVNNGCFHLQAIEILCATQTGGGVNVM